MMSATGGFAPGRRTYTQLAFTQDSRQHGAEVDIAARGYSRRQAGHSEDGDPFWCCAYDVIQDLRAVRAGVPLDLLLG
jgi:hypothetical protein